jgi:hypothetical protein
MQLAEKNGLERVKAITNLNVLKKYVAGVGYVMQKYAVSYGGVAPLFLKICNTYDCSTLHPGCFTAGEIISASIKQETAGSAAAIFRMVWRRREDRATAGKLPAVPLPSIS